MRRVDDVAVVDVDPDVPRCLARSVGTGEEHEVARLKPVRRNPDAVGRVPLRRCVVRQIDPELREHVLDEARAVEAGLRARAAPLVRDAEVLHRDRDDGTVLPGCGEYAGRQEGIGRREVERRPQPLPRLRPGRLGRRRGCAVRVRLVCARRPVLRRPRLRLIRGHGGGGEPRGVLRLVRRRDQDSGEDQ